MKNFILADIQDPTLPLVLYGSGMYAKHILNFLNNAEIQVQAICVDADFLPTDTSTWNEIPIYSRDALHTIFPAYNLIIGFYTLQRAKEISWVAANPIYFFDETKLRPLAQLDILQAEMKNFFGHESVLLKTPNLLHLYLGCKKANIAFSGYDAATEAIKLSTATGITAITNSYFAIFKEIFCDEIYSSYEKYINGDYIIFDIGANRGYSSLYFAKDEKCKKVFSFEPNPSTLAFLHQNLHLNPEIKEKINVFEYGLSNSNEEVTFYIPQDGSDGVNSTELQFIDAYYSKERRANITETKITVKDAATTIADIIQESSTPPGVDKIIKIDIEGGEYKVLQNLKEADLLKEFPIIIGECHNGMEGIIEICSEDFHIASLFKENTEQQYTFFLIKKDEQA